MAASRVAPRRLKHPRLRVYESLRTAHLERARELEPASIAFFGRNYDFDPALAEGLDLVQLFGPADLVDLLLRHRVTELEINEPLMLMGLKHGLVAVASARLAGLVQGHRVRVVTYAIENGRPLSTPSRRLRTPTRRLAYRMAVKLLLSQVERIAFGTSAAMDAYQEQGIRARTRTTLVPAISTACPCVHCDEERSPTLLFLGTFDGRKGLATVLDTWPDVALAVPGARLVVVGQGDLEERVRRLSMSRSDVQLEVAPPRQEVHRLLRGAKALVLWSQPSPTWREQVGLPLVEGLSHGCLVVASDETGIAGWLAEHGHEVAPVGKGLDGLREALIRSLTSARRPDQVLADLPPVDGRLAADTWLWSS